MLVKFSDSSEQDLPQELMGVAPAMLSLQEKEKKGGHSVLLYPTAHCSSYL